MACTRANLDDYMKHMLHAIEVAGIDHVGVSGDFDGGGGVDGMNEVTDYPAITQRLMAAGYTKADVAKIWAATPCGSCAPQKRPGASRRPDMTYEHLDIVIENEVAWATMNRPERLNALNPKLVDELRDFFVGLYWRRDVRIVVLRAPGGRSVRAWTSRTGQVRTQSGPWAKASPVRGRSARSSWPCAAAPSRSSPVSMAQPAAAASPWPWPAMCGSPPRP